MGRFGWSLMAFNAAQLHVIDDLIRPCPRIIQTALLRSQVHALPHGIRNSFDKAFAIHLHDLILQ